MFHTSRSNSRKYRRHRVENTPVQESTTDITTIHVFRPAGITTSRQCPVVFRTCHYKALENLHHSTMALPMVWDPVVAWDRNTSTRVEWGILRRAYRTVPIITVATVAINIITISNRNTITSSTITTAITTLGTTIRRQYR